MFNQDQINVITRSYSDEIVRLLEVKAMKDIIISNIRKEINEKNKKIEELEKKIKELTPEPEKKSKKR